MKQNRKRKPTSKDCQKAIEELRYILMGTRSQVMSLTEIFSNFLDFTNNKPKFMEYLKARVEKDKAGSVKNPEVKQKVVDPV